MSQADWDTIDAYNTRGEEYPGGYVYAGPEKGYIPFTPTGDDGDAPTTPGGTPAPAPASQPDDGKGGKGGKKQTPAGTVAAVRQITSPLNRLGDRVSQAPMPGGIGGPLAALALLTLAIVPVKTIDGKGMSRLQLLWLVLAGSLALDTGSSGSGGNLGPGAIKGPGGTWIDPTKPPIQWPSLGDAQPNVNPGALGVSGPPLSSDLSAAGLDIFGGAGTFRALPAF